MNTDRGACIPHVCSREAFGRLHQGISTRCHRVWGRWATLWRCRLLSLTAVGPSSVTATPPGWAFGGT